jgi:hypothetical protein
MPAVVSRTQWDGKSPIPLDISYLNLNNIISTALVLVAVPSGMGLITRTAGDALHFSDSSATNFNIRFYRAVVRP